jgi:hypothetical protein
MSEYALLQKFPSSVLAPFRENQDTNGYIGFHRRDGQWYEAGMQRGGCWILIAAVVAGNEQRADDAWRSIETTFAHQIEDGGFVSNRRPEAAHPPTLDERVETAYFYLQELAHAILVVRASPMEPHFHDRIAGIEPRLRRACDFIVSGYATITRKVSGTANRLFIAAKAFGLSGMVLKDERLKGLARQLAAEGLKRRDADGVFIERSGRDSSYNAVSLLMAQVYGLYFPDPGLDAAVARAMVWERSRIQPSGEVLIQGNTRTGPGKEQMMGHAKEINYQEVALALSYYGALHDDQEALALAEKTRAWSARKQP